MPGVKRISISEKNALKNNKSFEKDLFKRLIVFKYLILKYKSLNFHVSLEMFI